MSAPDASAAVTVPDRLIRRALGLGDGGARRILGITGAPGAGKSTLAEALRHRLNQLSPGYAVVVPMDGFHLRQARLVELGREGRKGAPDTFDVDAYVDLLRRLRSETGDVTAPAFDRVTDEPVDSRIRVPAAAPLVITEGNYLLLDDGGWERVAPLLDEAWYVDVIGAVRLEQLARRHVAYGKSEAEARAWAAGSDQRNAELVERSRVRADVVVTDFGTGQPTTT